MEYTNLDKCISYLCEYIMTNGPFDGLLSFSPGKVLRDHPPMKLFISISESKFRNPTIFKVAYKDPIKVRTVHFIGAKDWLKSASEDLAASFANPLIIQHPQGHTVPRLGDDTEANATEKNDVGHKLEAKKSEEIQWTEITNEKQVEQCEM